MPCLVFILLKYEQILYSFRSPQQKFARCNPFKMLFGWNYPAKTINT